MKRILAVLLAVVLGISFSACGKENASSGDGSSVSEQSNSASTDNLNDVVESEDIEASETGESIESTESSKPASSAVSGKPAEEGQSVHTHTFYISTCTEPKKCACGATEPTNMEHTWRDATCIAPKTCTVCGATEGEALGHRFAQTTTQSTCSKEGTLTEVCKVCSEKTVRTLPLKEHTYVKSILPENATHHKIINECSVCGYGSAEAVFHNWGAKIVVTAPTKQSEGTSKRVCTECNYEKIEAIAKIPYTQEEKLIRVYELVNIERQKVGLAPLTYNTNAQSAANVRAAEIHTLFSHDRPNGTQCFTALDEAGVSYYSAGENIAIGQTTPEEVVNDWMNSAGHRANILGNFTSIAVGFKDNAWVQFFLG